MLDYTINILVISGFSLTLSKILSNILLLLIILIISLIIKMLINSMIIKKVSLYIKNNKYKWDDILLKRNVFSRLSNVLIPIVIYFFTPSFSYEFQGIVRKIAFIYLTIVILFLLSALLTSANDIYNILKKTKSKHIKVIVQILQLILYLFGLIIIISGALGKSPVIILSSIGALAAVLLVVFKDSLLGIISGIQLSTNDMIRIGDWIEMPKYHVNGEIIDISLNTIKVENFDKTVTNIPSSALLSDSFKNWRNMQESGGMSIKRSINIDSSCIEFCSLEMIRKLESIRYLSQYIEDKKSEIKKYDNNINIDPTRSVNVRRITNLGAFREYISQYLNNHPSIHKNMIQIVRELEPGIYGVPLEIHAFTNDTNWLNYEKIQADIFEHLLSIAPAFNIRIFQNPSGRDINLRLEKRDK